MNYNGPGNLTELNEALQRLWQHRLDLFFERGVLQAKQEHSPPFHRSWFFNPLVSDVSNTSAADIRWNAFPKRLLNTFGSKLAAWREADKTRDRQEEYCEWEVVKDSVSGKVTRVTFTTEVPEYYAFLAESDPSLLLDLYHRYVSAHVKIEDLVTPQGGYIVQNIWNYPERQDKRGVLMHMGFGPNTLGAAINLSAEATWPSVTNEGEPIVDEQGLIRCRRFGAPERHSDPHIGAQINAIVRGGAEVSLAGPTGLYIDEVDLSGFQVPGGGSAEELMRVVRGDADHMMRVVFEAPTGAPYVLGDVMVDGDRIVFGGQIAEKITVRVRGIARDIGEVPPSITCTGTPVPEIAALAIGAVGSRRAGVTFLTSPE